MFMVRLNPRDPARASWSLRHVMRITCLIASLLGLGMGCRAGPSPEAPPSQRDDSTTAASQLAAMWSLASHDRQVRTLLSVPINHSLQYRLDAGCPLIYDVDFHTEHSQTLEDVKTRPRKDQIVGRLELVILPESSRREWTLRHQVLGFYHMHHGLRRAGHEYWPGQLPAVRLLPHERKLESLDEASPLWHGMGGFIGFAHLWPELPSENSLPPSMSRSTILIPSRSNQQTAAQTGEYPSVQVLTWLEVDNQPAALLEARGTFKTLEDDAVRTGSFVARYVVLTTGALLHAGLVQNITRHRTADSAEHWRIAAEARLTGACDAPTLAPFNHRASRIEAAMEAYLRFVHTLEAGAWDKLPAWFATDLLEAHGNEPIVELLQAHVSHYGIEVMGGPTWTDYVDGDGDLFQLQIAGRARGIGDDHDGEVTVLTHVTVEATGEEIRIL
ncbi:MAG: hypothetical protein ACNA8W_22605, partial [Bradymonadaceae bacterium]